MVLRPRALFNIAWGNAQELGKYMVSLANGHIYPGREWIDYGLWPTERLRKSQVQKLRFGL